MSRDRNYLNLNCFFFYLKFACIVGGAQKLLGPAGVTIVIGKQNFIIIYRISSSKLCGIYYNSKLLNAA